jgi:hypothetical protein
MKKTKTCQKCGVILPYTERNGLKTYKQKYGYGLDCGCYRDWLISDDKKAKEVFDKFLIKNKIDYQKKKKAEFRAKKQEFNEKGLMSSADTYFSRYIRLKHSENGKCTCYTCGDIKDIKEVDNGHYMKREHKATRYHENNCRPQCKKCNGDTKHNGKQIEFREYLCNEIGENNVVKIEKLSKTSIKANHVFYKETSDFYRKKVNEMQKELKVKYW